MDIDLFFQEFVKIVMKTFGVTIIMLALIICLIFLIWVIKIEFEWFFETDFFKLLNSISDKFKPKFKKDEKEMKKAFKELNHKKKKVVLNEEKS